MYDNENIFAKMLRSEIPVAAIYEDENVLAFNDIAPAAKIHVLVIPKGEYSSFDDFAAKAGAEKVTGFFASVQKIAEELGVVESGYRLITNHGADAHQTVAHFHVHILAGGKLGPLLSSDDLER